MRKEYEYNRLVKVVDLAREIKNLESWAMILFDGICSFESDDECPELIVKHDEIIEKISELEKELDLIVNSDFDRDLEDFYYDQARAN